MTRRSQYLPWHVAGQLIDQQRSAEDVVRRTGWVFNGQTGADLTLRDFVDSGTVEADRYLAAFGLLGDGQPRSLVEIGAGIGRMTCAFTHHFDTVFACDIDVGFLERCREAVAAHGNLRRLRTVPVPDGRTLDLPDGRADVAFSYITLQHCTRGDALALTAEAARVTAPGGRIALNFRSRTPTDAVVVPAGGVTRALLRTPLVGNALSRRRAIARLSWQAHRLSPADVLPHVRAQLRNIAVYRQHWRPGQAARLGSDVQTVELADINPAHWWLVADRA